MNKIKFKVLLSGQFFERIPSTVNPVTGETNNNWINVPCKKTVALKVVDTITKNTVLNTSFASNDGKFCYPLEFEVDDPNVERELTPISPTEREAVKKAVEEREIEVSFSSDGLVGGNRKLTLNTEQSYSTTLGNIVLTKAV